jgi:type VI secretion system secreted protein VgrG
VRSKLSSEHGKTQLNQGYLTHPRQDGAAEPRGEGFELRTDRAGALRAGEGLLLSAYERRNAHGGQIDREETIALLNQALAIARDLSQHAQAHQADDSDTDEQARLLRDIQQWEEGHNTEPDKTVQTNKAILAMTTPDGIALATESNITTVAGTNADTVVVNDHNLSVGQMLKMRIGGALSVFVQHLGMKLIAAAGKIQIQAQDGEVEIGAAKKLHLYSLEEIVLDAPKITLRAQNAGVEYGEGILSRTTGSDVRHAGNHSAGGPASVAAQLPGMPQSVVKTNEQFTAVDRFGKALENVQYEVKNSLGKTEGAGSTDGSGSTPTFTGKAIEKLKMYLK